MITSEARSILAADVKRLTEAVESGKIFPQDVPRMVLGSIVRRASFDAPDGLPEVATAAVNGRVSAATHSDMLAVRAQATVQACIPRLDPESISGLLLYVVGDTRQHGLAIVGLQLLAESSGVEAATRLIAYRDSILAVTKRADQELIERVPTLPSGVRRSVLGALQEARSYLAEGDERSAANFFGTARRLIRRFSP
jgi:hypothetical protein